MEVIMKYKMLKTFGGNYTWNSLDNEDNLGLLLIALCMKYEEKAMQWNHSRQNFVSEEILQ